MLSEPVDIADMFTRVEAIPREQVLPLFEAKKTWRTAAGYRAHLDSLPLGPNVAALNSGDVNQNSGNTVDASTRNNTKQTNTQSNTAGQSQMKGCCSRESGEIEIGSSSSGCA